MRRSALFLAAILLVVPACGGGGTDVSEAAAIRLEPEVQALRQAAADGNREAAGQELADLRRLVDELSATGELGGDGARRILAAATEVEANLDLLASTSTIPATTAATTAPPITTTEPPLPPLPPATEDKRDKEDKEEDDEDDEEEDEEDETPRPPGNGNRPRD
jgi:hypothetical protein